MSNPLLEQLAPIAQPLAPGVWPLAYGWWLLIVLAVILVTVSVAKFVAFRRFWAIKRLALSTLAHCSSTREINGLIKQVALHYFPCPTISSMHGEAWVEFLSRANPSDSKMLQQTINNLYREETAQDLEQFATLASNWLNALTKKNIKDIGHA